MGTIVIGDIHGNIAALNDVLSQVRAEAAEGDAVVFLGDYIDRGDDSRACIDAIISFRAETRAEVICLRGNHEEWLLRTLSDFTHHSWLLGMDGLSTVRSYSPDAEQALRGAMTDAGLQLYVSRCELPYKVFVDAMPAAHRAFLSRLAQYVQTTDCICTHAGLDPNVTRMRDQPAVALTWGHASFPEAYEGAATVVYGHKNNAVVDSRGWPHPRIVGNTIGIDTIAHGVLTAIRMPERRVIQSHATSSIRR